jgi:hypothetical protein
MQEPIFILPFLHGNGTDEYHSLEAAYRGPLNSGTDTRARRFSSGTSIQERKQLDKDSAQTTQSAPGVVPQNNGEKPGDMENEGN